MLWYYTLGTSKKYVSLNRTSKGWIGGLYRVELYTLAGELYGELYTLADELFTSFPSSRVLKM